jgi:hypothetical protein
MCRQARTRGRLLALALVVAAPVAAQDTIDPNNMQAQFAWSENAGWWNAEPRPPGGALPGVVVTDTKLTGYLWAENLGWVNLSCQNRGTCGTARFGVQNDGGRLSGLGWAENAGWIVFDPKMDGTPVAGAGVQIDTATGVFSGKAWGENVGWVSFSLANPTAAPFQVQTSWRPVTPTPSPTATRTPGGPVSTPTATGSQASPTRTPPATRTPGGTPLPSTGPPASLILLVVLGLLALSTWRRGSRQP